MGNPRANGRVKRAQPQGLHKIHMRAEDWPIEDSGPPSLRSGESQLGNTPRMWVRNSQGCHKTGIAFIGVGRTGGSIRSDNGRPASRTLRRGRVLSQCAIHHGYDRVQAFGAAADIGL